MFSKVISTLLNSKISMWIAGLVKRDIVNVASTTWVPKSSCTRSRSRRALSHHFTFEHYNATNSRVRVDLYNAIRPVRIQRFQVLSVFFYDKLLEGGFI